MQECRQALLDLLGLGPWSGELQEVVVRIADVAKPPIAKSDGGDAHALADMVRIDATQLRPIAGDSERAQAVKAVARAHQTLIWERTRTFQRLRNTLREYFPGALTAYADLELTSTDALELLIKAPTGPCLATSLASMTS